MEHTRTMSKDKDKDGVYQKWISKGSQVDNESDISCRTVQMVVSLRWNHLYLMIDFVIYPIRPSNLSNWQDLKNQCYSLNGSVVKKTAKYVIYSLCSTIKCLISIFESTGPQKKTQAIKLVNPKSNKAENIFFNNFVHLWARAIRI